MKTLKELLKEAFGEYGYEVNQIEPEVKKILGKLIKSIEPYSNTKSEKGHIKFNFKDKESMKQFLSKEKSYVDSIESLLSRKFGVQVYMAGITKGDLMLSFSIFSEMKDIKRIRKSMDSVVKQKSLKALDIVLNNIKPYSEDASFLIQQTISIIEKFKDK